MSQPSERHPGTTWFITARTERREMRLKPTPDMTAAFAVAFCDAAERYGIEPTAVHVAGNHYHAVLFDPLGRVSDFMKDAHGLVARFGNAVEQVHVIFGGTLRYMLRFKMIEASPALAAYAERLGARPALQRAEARNMAIAHEHGLVH